jgi:hypothetical protein
MLLVAAGGLLVVTGEAADEKSPKSPPKDSFRGAAVMGCDGGDVGFEGAAGFMSKKDPPLREAFAPDACLA